MRGSMWRSGRLRLGAVVASLALVLAGVPAAAAPPHQSVGLSDSTTGAEVVGTTGARTAGGADASAADPGASDATAPEPPSLAPITGSYEFVTLGTVPDDWGHRTTLSNDGARTAFRPGYIDPAYQELASDHLELVDTLTGQRTRASGEVAPGDSWHHAECVVLSGDGSTVLFTAGNATLHDLLPPGFDFSTWAFAFDADSATLTPLPLPDPALQGDSWNSDPCPMAVNDDGSRVIYRIWDQLFLTELAPGGGDLVATRLMGDLNDNYPPQVAMNAAGTRVLIDGQTRWWGEGDGMKSVAVHDIDATFTQVWSGELLADTPIAMSADGGTLVWAQWWWDHETRDPELSGYGAVFHDIASGEQALVELVTGWPAEDLMGDDSVTFELTAGATAVFLAHGARVMRHRVGHEGLELVADASEAFADLECYQSDQECFPVLVDLEVSADGEVVAALLVDGMTYRQDRIVVIPSELVIGRQQDVELVAPTWPSGAQIHLAEVGATFATLNWDEAEDDRAVTGYEVQVDGEVVATTPAAVRTVTVSDLAPDTDYIVTIVPTDAHALRGPGLTLSLRTSAPAELAALTASARVDGTVLLRWDPATPAAETYRVLREGAVVAETNTLTWTDTAVPAETTLTYRIEAVRAGTAATHTREASVTTPAIPEPELQWGTTRLPGGWIDMTAPVSFTATGQPHRTAAATLLTTTSDGGELTREVHLTETSPGHYTGSLPDSTGTAEITAVSATLSDQAGHQATGQAPWTTLPARVSGAIEVLIDADAPTPGATVDITSASLRWSRPHVIDGEASRYAVAVPPSSDYTVTLWSAQGARVGTEAELTVTPGRLTSRTMEHVLPASLRLEIVDGAGAPLPGVVVEVRVPGQKNVTKATTDATGVVVSTGWYDRDTAEVTFSSRTIPIPPHDPITVDLAPGERTVRLTPAIVPEGELTGRLTAYGTSDGRGTVRLTQLIEGVHRTETATPNADGTFALTGFHGPATVTLSHPTTGGTSEEVIIGPEPLVLDRDLTVPGREVLDLDLRILDYGATTPGPAIVVDWSTAVHLRVQVQQLVDGEWRWRSASWTDSTTWITWKPGTTLRVCADAVEAGGPAGCSEPVTMSEQGGRIPVSLTLRSTARLSLDLVTAAGEPVTGSWRATVTGEGRNLSLAGQGEELALDLPAGGTYQVRVSGPSGTGNLTVDVPADSHHAPGEPLVLGARGGAFSGEGNAVVPLQREVLPGDLVELRTTYRTGLAVRDAALHLTLPPGWTPVDNGLVVDGEPATATLSEDVVAVPLGDLAVGDEGVIRLAVQVPDEVTSGSHPVLADVVVPTIRNPFPIGVVTVEVAGVSLSAPESVWERSASLSGRAPADALVRVVTGDEVVGLTQAGPSGRWEMRATDLPTIPVGHHYSFRAVTELGDTEVVSAEARTLYDPFQTRLIGIELAQDGRSVQWNPADGVARFPFVYVNRDAQVHLTFDHPERVRSATVWLGDMMAEAHPGPDGRLTATLPYRFGRGGLIYVDYQADRAPVDLESADLGLADSVTEASAVLPEAWSDLAIGDVVEEQAPGGEYDAGFTASLPARTGLPGGVSISFSVSATEVPGYTPDAAGQARARASGVPVHDGTLSVSGGGASGRASGVFVRPANASGAGAALPAGAPSGPTARLSPEPQAAAQGARMAFQIAWNITGGVDNINTLFGQGQRESAIRATIRDIEALVACDAEDFARITALNAEARALLMNAIDLDIFNIVSMVAGTAAGILLPFVGGFAVGVFLWALGQDLGTNWDSQHSALRSKIWQKECPTPKPPPPPPGPAGDPRDIFDPSGYVFEAFEDNRLEGVTATVLYAPAPEGPWQVWDAEWYGQRNPLLTDAEGRYAWDVPVGFWQVRYEKEGYQTAFSEVLEVLPPHFDVNVGLISTQAPAVTAVTAIPDEVRVAFSQPIAIDSLSEGAITLTTAQGEEIPGQIVVSERARTADGVAVTTAATVVPATPLPAETEVAVLVLGGVRNYVERPLGQDVRRIVTVQAVPVECELTEFIDVPESSEFIAEILWLACQGVTDGWQTPDGRQYRPLVPVERQAMAAFLYRLAGSPDWTAPSTSPFRDLTPEDDFFAEITWLAHTGITTGWEVAGGREFRSLEPTARDAMAAFLYRYTDVVLGQEVAGFVPPSTSPFRDVRPGMSFYREITWLAASGISRGWSDGTFRPYHPVNRDAMAAFMFRMVHREE